VSRRRAFGPDIQFLIWAFVTGFGIAGLFAVDYFSHLPSMNSPFTPFLFGGLLPTVLSALAFIFWKRKAWIDRV
jgi:hypothetical protein